MRGQSACGPCAGGHYAGCLRSGEAEGFSPGNFLGFHNELGGGWADAMVVHRSQIIRLPERLSDKTAAILEPLAVAVHAAGKHLPRAEDHVLVIGGGPIAPPQVAALRMLECKARITVSTMAAFQAELALSLGATSALSLGPKDSTARLAELAGARAYKPMMGADVYAGGFDVIFDCIGTRASIDQSLRLCRPRGTVVLVGAAGLVPLIDFTFVWSKELTLKGTLAYDTEDDHARKRTFDLAAERASTTALPLDSLVTHVMPLAKYEEAIWANVHRGRSRAVKTLLEP
jgi:threonine dehydrogenase-like Zn-dependent dehydrogenase